MQTPKASLTVSIDDRGVASAQTTVPLRAKPPQADLSGAGHGLWIVALPFALEPGYAVKSAPDILISPLALGDGYTLLAIISPISYSEVRFQIVRLTRLHETRGGKAQIMLDLAYTFMSQAERDLLASPTTISSFDINVQLPQKYDETEVSFRPQFLKKSDDRTYSLSAAEAQHRGVTKVWVAFPSPMEHDLYTRELLFSFVVGCLALTLHLKALRNRRIWWSILVLAFSSAVLIVTVYCSATLAKRLEFLAFSAATVPHAAYGLCASVYLLLAKRLQAEIRGQVTIGGIPTPLAEVILYRTTGDSPKQVSRLDPPEPGGSYVFYKWQGKQPVRYQVVARSSIADEAKTPHFEASRGKKCTAPLLNLNWRPIQDTRRNGHPGSPSPGAS